MGGEVMATIVLAEDDVHIARVVSIWLEQHSHRVLGAFNGRDALHLVRRCRPEVLIADVNIPVMDGIELLQACASEGLPTVGSIVLTSRCDQAEMCDRLDGLKTVLHPKPFSPSRLLAEVERLIATAGEEEPISEKSQV
jgi:DNA-binding response OmpR family regulator